MSWEWSHSPEAYAAARRNLDNLSPGEIRVIWAEWEATDFKYPDTLEGPSLDVERYENAHRRAQVLSPEYLCADIWNRMEALRTCENGGAMAWACPYGCHLVSFSDEEVCDELQANA